MAVVKVRVVRTWDVEVPAEYGDTDNSLVAKVSESWLDETPPDADDRCILPVYAEIIPQADYDAGNGDLA